MIVLRAEGDDGRTLETPLWRPVVEVVRASPCPPWVRLVGADRETTTPVRLDPLPPPT
jgi:hypothetical protein